MARHTSRTTAFLPSRTQPRGTPSTATTPGSRSLLPDNGSYAQQVRARQRRPLNAVTTPRRGARHFTLLPPLRCSQTRGDVSRAWKGPRRLDWPRSRTRECAPGDGRFLDIGGAAIGHASGPLDEANG